jgi:hypothetical protein
MEKLIVHPASKPQESLAGYILRLSELNGLRGFFDVLSLAGMSTQYASMISTFQLFDERRSHLGWLPAVIGRPLSELQSLTYALPRDIGRPESASWGAQQMPLRAMRTKHGCICPECLLEDPYVRQSWDWSLITTCSEHKRYLLSECPSCHTPISRARTEVCKCLCLYDFRDAALGAEERLKAQVDELTVFVSHETTYDYDFLLAWTTLAAISSDAPSLIPDLLKFAQLDCVTQHYHLKEALSVWDEGPTRFLKGVRENRSFLVSVLGPRCASLPFYRHSAAVKAAFALSECEKSMNGFTALGTSLPSSESESEAENFAAILSCSDVAYLLNVALRVVTTSIEYGALLPLRGPSVDGFGSWRFSVKDVVTFLSKIVVTSLQVGPTYRFADAGRPSGIFGVPGTGRLMGSLRNGTMRVVAYDAAIGLPSLSVQSTTLPEPVKEVENFIGIKEAGARLVVHPTLLYPLIKAKFIPATKVRGQFQISLEDFAIFHAKYVFAGELARELKTNHLNLAEKLMTCGANPISGPRVDGTIVYLFLRSDVAKLDLPKVASMKKYFTNTGRRPLSSPPTTKDYLTSAEAAQQLGISMPKLGILVRRNFIEGRTHFVGRNARYFLQVELDQYLSAFRNNAEFLPIHAAANFLGVSLWHLHQRWVKRRIIEVYDDGLQRYLRVSDLRRIDEERKELLTSKEASIILGVTQSTLLNWRAKGIVDAIPWGDSHAGGLLLFSSADIEKLRGDVDSLNVRSAKDGVKVFTRGLQRQK